MLWYEAGNTVLTIAGFVVLSINLDSGGKRSPLSVFAVFYLTLFNQVPHANATGQELCSWVFISASASLPALSIRATPPKSTTNLRSARACRVCCKCDRRSAIPILVSWRLENEFLLSLCVDSGCRQPSFASFRDSPDFMATATTCPTTSASCDGKNLGAGGIVRSSLPMYP